MEPLVDVHHFLYFLLKIPCNEDEGRDGGPLGFSAIGEDFK